MQPNEASYLYQARLHWVIFFWPIFGMLSSLYLATHLYILHTPAMLLAALALFWALLMFASYQLSSLTIKSASIELRNGVLVRQTLDIPVNKIESLDIRQSILGSIFQYGSLIITGTGGTKQYIHFLRKPLTCRRYIEQLIQGLVPPPIS